MFRRFLGYVRPYRWWAILAFTSMFGVALGNGALVALTRPLFDEVLIKQKVTVHPSSSKESSAVANFLLRRDEPEGQRGAIVNTIDKVQRRSSAWWNEHRGDRWKIVLLLIVIVYLIRAVSMFASEYAFEKVGLSTVRDMRNQLYETIIQQSSRFFSRRSTGELVSRIVSDVEMVQSALSVRMGDLFQQSATVVVLAVFVFFANFELAVISFLAAPVIIVPIAQFTKRLRRAAHKTQERMADVSTLLEETIKGVRIVKAFAMEAFEIRRFNDATQRHLDINLKARKIQALSSPVLELLGGISAVLLIGYAAVRIRSGVMTTGQFISFVVALTMMYTPVKKLNKANLAISAAVSATERIFSMIDTPNEIVEKPGATDLESLDGGVEYEAVSFAYNDDPVLSRIDLRVSRGEMLAIVGTSGAGKSTLVNLLPRFYDVTGGRILVDGQDIRDLTLRSLRAMIGIVTQEVILFNDTIRNNIAYGRDDVDDERLRAVAQAANAREFIESAPQGYDTWIGEGGVLLSGGQRQRIAIARALLKDPPLLILDEATSALDTESERLVQEALFNLMEGRTTLVIAHRLSTVRRADRIVVLDAGRISEEGTHDELIARGGIYRRLYELQFVDQHEITR